MPEKNYRETSRRGGMLWLLQRVSAVVIFVLLMIHYVTYHFIGDGTITYDRIVAKMASPWFNLTQILFLATALFHGLNGVWMVTEDYIHQRGLRLMLAAILLLLGLLLLYGGTSTVLNAGYPGRVSQ